MAVLFGVVEQFGQDDVLQGVAAQAAGKAETLPLAEDVGGVDAAAAMERTGGDVLALGDLQHMQAAGDPSAVDFDQVSGRVTLDEVIGITTGAVECRNYGIHRCGPNTGPTQIAPFSDGDRSDFGGSGQTENLEQAQRGNKL